MLGMSLILRTKGGDLVVAKTGKVYGDIENLNQVVVEGKVVGNIFAERLQLRGFASVHGDITCKSVNIGPNVVLVGSLNIHPLAPKVIDSNGNIVVPSKVL